MHSLIRPEEYLQRGKIFFSLCLVALMLLSQVFIVRADHVNDNYETARNLRNLNSDLHSLIAPVAANDSGDGFITYQDRAVNTANVLANDVATDGDRLFVADVDTSSTIGLVSPMAGLMDKSFGVNGKASVEIGMNTSVSDVAIQPDGKIVMAGTGWNSTSSYDFIVLRFNTDGSLDQSFGQGGKVITDFGWTDRARAVAIQSDNKILVVGYIDTNQLGIARYNVDGSLDTGFGGDGKVTTDGVAVYDMGPMGITQQADGKIIAVGSCFTNNGYEILIVRFNIDGSPDTSFDQDGIMTAMTGYSSVGRDVVVLPDQKLLVSGFGTYAAGSGSGFVIARIDPNGGLDKSFQGGGILLTDVGASINGTLGLALALQDDQKFVTIGNTNDNFAMLRYNPNGSLDTTFDGDGIVLNNAMKGQDIKIQPDGKILVAGTIGTYDTGMDITVYRYNQDGSIDSTFGQSGSININFGDDRCSAIALGQKGTIDIAGYTGNLFTLAQLIGDGTFTYDPNHQFDYLKVGEQALDTFGYTVSDGVLTDTALVTITINGFSKYTYLPLVSYRLKLYGKVTQNGTAAPGISLLLRFFNGSQWSTQATTVTDSNGVYNFVDVPDLAPGQKYYVLYSNTSDPNRLWVWGTREITSYTQYSSINIGNFDIANIGLSSPPPGSSVKLPYVFQWVPRPASVGDSYEYDLYDPYNVSPYYYTPLLGYVANYLLPGLPAGFVNNHLYAWEIWAYSPDGGSGISYYTYGVYFYNSATGQMETAMPIQRKDLSEIDAILRK